MDESSTSVSLETNEESRPLHRSDKKYSSPRGRQRRNDEPSTHRSASEPRSQRKKKRSSSEKPINTSASGAQLHLQSSNRNRNARSLSKASQREPHNSPSLRHSASASPNTDTTDNYSALEGSKKMKSWRSKFSAGMKKHLSPTSQHSVSSPPPLHSKQVKKSSSSGREKRQSNATESRGSYPPQPINVGDSITLTQQYLEESMEMSVITLPKELAMMKEVDEENLMQIVGQRGVLGNNAVQAFLDRRSGAANGGAREEDLQIQPATSEGMYERVSSYANRLLDISYSQSMENNGNMYGGEEGVEVDADGNMEEQVSPSHQSMVVGKHSWPCDPTADGYSPRGVDKKNADMSSVVTEQEIASIGAPPSMLTAQEMGSIGVPPPASPPPPPPQSSERRIEIPMPASSEQRRPFDEPSAGLEPCVTSFSPDPELDDDPDKPFRSNKSVSFCLPPPSSHPPAPPFLGPTLDYYYSMERPSNDPMPNWSNSSLLPPIIELWSSVDGNADAVGGNMTMWNNEREKELIGEDAPLIVSEKWIEFSEQLSANVEERLVIDEKKIDALKQPKASPGDTSIDYMDDILDCEETPNPDRDSLRYSESTAVASHRSTQDSLAGINIPMPSGDDAKFRHRSQWNSSHGNMKYQPPMFNTGDITKMDAPVLPLGGSESSDDPVLQIRRYHGDNIPSPKKQQPQDASRPIILHGRVVRPANIPTSTASQSKYSITRSPSTSSHGSTASSANAKTYAAIAIQASARGMLERQRFMDVLDSVLIIQPVVRRFLCRQLYVRQMKLKRSYFLSNWRRKMMNNDS
jgi:hypothetical protein